MAMQYDGTTYLPTWQTWQVVRPHARSQPEPRQGEIIPPAQDARQLMRERVQIARIEQRMTVNDLANRVSCEVDTIVAFESGYEILSSDLQKKIRSVLKID